MKASSESGLWAILISRTSAAVMDKLVSPEYGSNSSAREDVLPRFPGSSGKHDFDDLGEDATVQAERNRRFHGRRHAVTPTQAASKQPNLAGNAGCGSGHEGLLSPLRNTSDQR